MVILYDARMALVLVFPASEQINLPPFTKDFCGGGHIIDYDYDCDVGLRLRSLQLYTHYNKIHL